MNLVEVDAETAKALQAAIRRRYRGTGGITVRMSPDGTTVIIEGGGGGGGMPNALPVVKVLRNPATGIQLDGAAFQAIENALAVVKIDASGTYLVEATVCFEARDGISAAGGSTCQCYIQNNTTGTMLGGIFGKQTIPTPLIGGSPNWAGPIGTAVLKEVALLQGGDQLQIYAGCFGAAATHVLVRSYTLMAMQVSGASTVNLAVDPR